MSKLFRNDNTEGYSEVEMASLNEEWAIRVDEQGLVEGSDEYYQAAAAFRDEVAAR